jgi:centromeric protein E
MNLQLPLSSIWKMSKPFANIVKDMGSSTRNTSSSKVLGRSRGCRSFTGSSLFEDLEKDDCTPPATKQKFHRFRCETSKLSKGICTELV